MRLRHNRNSYRRSNHEADQLGTVTHPLGHSPLREEFTMYTLKHFTMALLVMVVAGVIASGCNTFKGAGRDIQKGGQAVENAAEDVQDSK